MNEEIYKNFGIDSELLALAGEVEKEVEPIFKEIEKTCEFNSLKVLQAFQHHHIYMFHQQYPGLYMLHPI